MTDRTGWGLAKFWAMTAAEQGVDVHDRAAFQRFADRAQRGEEVGDAALADRLRIAIGGRGAFRRFKDVLAGDERSWSRYHRFRDERQRGRARAWLAEEGYCPHITFFVEPSSGSCPSGPV
ncbi:hypothetical protein AB0937_00900 [Streptomyces sp. NPDC047880]|uniref:hypothetical protein n=1 Tax=Streptomyces sp. NPDC047880 TaxID=3155626 RepID=UPI0034538F56